MRIAAALALAVLAVGDPAPRRKPLLPPPAPDLYVVVRDYGQRTVLQTPLLMRMLDQMGYPSVEAIQADAGLTADGVLGPKTEAAIRAAFAREFPDPLPPTNPFPLSLTQSVARTADGNEVTVTLRNTSGRTIRLAGCLTGNRKLGLWLEPFTLFVGGNSSLHTDTLIACGGHGKEVAMPPLPLTLGPGEAITRTVHFDRLPPDTIADVSVGLSILEASGRERCVHTDEQDLH